ncbi:MAG: YbaK/EbsC family protein [Peptostreptococcus sp.]|uniref:prolyl-tRNA synthetase associated domain-containing protein n=1 Tax=Peptostreptococcus sp. TaxID=1262 RepID=UPI002FCA672E
MFFVSEISTKKPSGELTKLQEKVYESLSELEIDFERVDTEEAITMQDCISINEKLNMNMVKTLFLCNRKKTEFYLFITTGQKAFKSKEFSKALDISRVSFAPAELMQEKLGTKIGAATVFSSILDNNKEINIVFDSDVLKEEYYGCSDGVTTSYMKLKTEDIVEKYLPYTKHVYKEIEL